MSIDDLIKAAQEYQPTEKDILELDDLIREMEAKFEEDERKRRPSPEWYERTYTL